MFGRGLATTAGFLERIGGEAQLHARRLTDPFEELLAAEPETFFSFGGFSRNGATGVRFARVKKQVFGELLGEAWRNVAPKKPGDASVRSRTKRRASRPG